MLDGDLLYLGISPHPRAVLAVEGETEQAPVPLIWKQCSSTIRTRRN